MNDFIKPVKGHKLRLEILKGDTLFVLAKNRTLSFRDRFHESLSGVQSIQIGKKVQDEYEYIYEPNRVQKEKTNSQTTQDSSENSFLIMK